MTPDSPARVTVPLTTSSPGRILLATFLRSAQKPYEQLTLTLPSTFSNLTLYEWKTKQQELFTFLMRQYQRRRERRLFFWQLFWTSFCFYGASPRSSLAPLESVALFPLKRVNTVKGLHLESQSQ